MKLWTHSRNLQLPISLPWVVDFVRVDMERLASDSEENKPKQSKALYSMTGNITSDNLSVVSPKKPQEGDSCVGTGRTSLKAEQCGALEGKVSTSPINSSMELANIKKESSRPTIEVNGTSSDEESVTDSEEMVEEKETEQNLTYLKKLSKNTLNNIREKLVEKQLHSSTLPAFNTQRDNFSTENVDIKTSSPFTLLKFFRSVLTVERYDENAEDKLLEEIEERLQSAKVLHTRGHSIRALECCKLARSNMERSKLFRSFFDRLIRKLVIYESDFDNAVNNMKRSRVLTYFKLERMSQEDSKGKDDSGLDRNSSSHTLDLLFPEREKRLHGEMHNVWKYLVECCFITGSCLYKLGSFSDAFEWFQLCHILDESNCKVLCGLSTTLREVAPDRITEALDYLRKAYEFDVSDPEVAQILASFLVDIGVRLKLAGLSKEAISYYQEALSVYPTFSQACYNLGVTFADLGKTDDALRYYTEAVQCNPHHAEAYCNAGVIYKEKGDLMTAIEKYKQSLESNPNFDLARNNLAIAYSDLGTVWKTKGDLSKSVYYYKKSLSLNPCYPDAHYNLGVAYSEARKFDRAVTHYELAIRFNPSHTESLNNLGVLYKEMGNLERAIASYKAALNINPQYFQTHNNLAVVYTIMGACDLAKEHLSMAIALNSSYAEAHNNLGVLLRDEGDIHGAIEHYEQCLRTDPRAEMTAQNRLHALNYADEYDVETIYHEHKKWGDRFLKRIQKEMEDAANSGNEVAKTLSERRVVDSIPRGPNYRLRIGYISPDFFTHSVSYFIEAPLYYHDSENMEIFIYSNTHWREIVGESTLVVCQKILQDRIDILIELAGHTAGNRLDVMAAQPAPIQVTWIGYPNTTGLPTVDYRLTDNTVDPENTIQKFTENLWRLPKCFLCYTPSADAPPCSTQIPAVNNGYCITFGSFNVLAKTQANTIALWSKILHLVPKSRLLLKAKPFASSFARRRFEYVFEAVGITPDRLDLLPLLPETRNHLETYSLVDICLDPFPYAGTTTTCEALYMGVPVVSLSAAGQNHAHSVGETLLKSIGHSELVAHSEEEYVDIAVSLASDLDRLKRLRSSLRNDMLSSPLCDGVTFVKELESAYCQMWQAKGGILE
ncbi:Probable UDP-N-acetylglucosamine--peptide N-acetylglucosaminyltransferase SPINDLY [Galdieria sulphuraria]|nr:Probable UDP-N-acetylglucosamine--peptide N-acetylglucosaminyltransferase SPINDLY [Galdieria sulphuraria]